MKGNVLVLLVDGFADWEPALVLPELRRAGHPIVTVGLERKPVRSTGGLEVKIDTSLAEIGPDGTSLLLLVGADLWARGDYPAEAMKQKLLELERAAVPIAAICGATVALARAGLFAERDHTSNDPYWLQAVAPNYAGSARYQNELAVRDRGVISASGTGFVELAREILAELDVMPAERLAIWTHLYRVGRFPAGADPQAFFAAQA